MPLHRHRTLLATEPEKSGLVYASDNNGAAVVGIKGKARRRGGRRFPQEMVPNAWDGNVDDVVLEGV